MNIAVMGAGAVGCYFGGMLARGGNAVTLIGRAPHVAALRRDGLLLDTQAFRAHVPIGASTEADGVRDARLVLFCVKSTDTDAAAAALAPHLRPDAIVLSLQNGVDNAERLRARLAQTVVAAVVYVATEMAGPGHVRHHGRGELVIGPSPASGEIVALFGACGVPVQVSDRVDSALWTKLTLNCAYNAMSAIAQVPYGELVRGTGVEAAMRGVVGECLAVAAAAGVALPGDTWDAVWRLAGTMPAQYSSTAQDLARGRRSEIDHLNGYVARRGAALGVDAPLNRLLHALVLLIEEARERRAA